MGWIDGTKQEQRTPCFGMCPVSINVLNKHRSIHEILGTYTNNLIKDKVLCIWYKDAAFNKICVIESSFCTIIIFTSITIIAKVMAWRIG